MKKIESNNTQDFKYIVLFSTIAIFLFTLFIKILNAYVNDRLGISTFLDKSNLPLVIMLPFFGFMIATFWDMVNSISTSTIRIVFRSILICLLGANMLIISVVSGVEDEGALGVGQVLLFIIIVANISAIIVGFICGMIAGRFQR